MQKEPSASATPPACVLIVDDEEPIRTLARSVLERAGHHILEAATATSALEQLSRAPLMVDVVLTDVLMPGRDGLSLAREIRRRAHTTEIIVMSAHLAPDHAWPEDLLDLRLITKPFTLAALNDAVGDAVARRRAREARWP